MRLIRAALSAAVVVPALAASVALPTADGRRIDPLQTKAKTVALIFTRSDCPISNRYAPEIQRLYTSFFRRGVDFWLVYVDPGESDSGVRAHLQQYGYTFGALLDRKHQLVSATKASVTPEAVVYSAGRMVYRGRIDDRVVSFGKSRPAPSRHDLEDALEQAAAGRAGQPRFTKAVGCFIEDLK